LSAILDFCSKWISIITWPLLTRNAPMYQISAKPNDLQLPVIHIWCFMNYDVKLKIYKTTAADVMDID